MLPIEGMASDVTSRETGSVVIRWYFASCGVIVSYSLFRFTPLTASASSGLSGQECLG